MKVDEHYDDCGEDLSSLTGSEMCSLAWTTSLHEDARPLIADEEHSNACDGLNLFILYCPNHTPDMKHTRTKQLQSLDELKHLVSRSAPGSTMLEISGQKSTQSIGHS